MTIDSHPPGDLDFRAHPVINRVALQANVFKEMLHDLDLKGASTVDFLISPEKPNFSLIISGDACTVEISYPYEIGSDTFSVFESQKTQVCRYNLHMFRSTLRAVNRADQVNIRMNENGMLSMQFVIRPHNAPSNVQNWIDFLLIPEIMDDDRPTQSAVH